MNLKILFLVALAAGLGKGVLGLVESQLLKVDLLNLAPPQAGGASTFAIAKK
ncbi:MAG: hypothetical protein AAFN81_25325 [Bacteroidota bacterium]